MDIKTLHVGPLLTNCYIVSGVGECVIVDPGCDAEKIKTAVFDTGKPCRGILITHSHYDHIGALRELFVEFNIPVYISANASPDDEYITVPLEDGDVVNIGSLCFDVMATPGHTADSLCFISGDVMFSGDTLFMGTVGRTDLGGDIQDMLKSLERIKKIDNPNMLVLPGHGFRTTLGKEKAENPFLAEGVL